MSDNALTGCAASWDADEAGDKLLPTAFGTTMSDLFGYKVVATNNMPTGDCSFFVGDEYLGKLEGNLVIDRPPLVGTLLTENPGWLHGNVIKIGDIQANPPIVKTYSTDGSQVTLCFSATANIAGVWKTLFEQFEEATCSFSALGDILLEAGSPPTRSLSRRRSLALISKLLKGR